MTASDVGVLARVVAGRYSTSTEDIATDTLAYLLNEYRPANRAFQTLLASLAPGLPDAVTWRTQDAGTEDTSVPDMVGVSADGDRNPIVESKFWAGLTEHQPTTYLGRLPADTPALLVFLVPDRRRSSIFGELIRRCREHPATKKISYGDDQTAEIDGRTLAVISWQRVLRVLHAALVEHDSSAGLADLRQLEGLCAHVDSEQILPFTAEELTGYTGQRIIDLLTLIDTTTDELVSSGRASTDHLASSASRDYSGRYLALRGWECLFHINYWRWAHEAPTPLWLQITDSAASDNAALHEALEPLRRAEPKALFETFNRLQIPLWLPAGVEKEDIVAALVAQLGDLHDSWPHGPLSRG